MHRFARNLLLGLLLTAISATAQIFNPSVSSAGLNSATLAFTYLKNNFAGATNSQGSPDRCKESLTASTLNPTAVLVWDYAEDSACGTHWLADGAHGDSVQFVGDLIGSPGEVIHTYTSDSTPYFPTGVNFISFAGQGKAGVLLSTGGFAIKPCNGLVDTAGGPIPGKQPYCNGTSGTPVTLPGNLPEYQLTSIACAAGTCTITYANGVTTPFVSGETVNFQGTTDSTTNLVAGYSMTSGNTFSCGLCASSTGGAAYGAAGITAITVSGGTATITWASSSGTPYALNQFITISNANSCNGTVQLTDVNGTQFAAGSCTTQAAITGQVVGPPMGVCTPQCNLSVPSGVGAQAFEALQTHLQIDNGYVLHIVGYYNVGCQEDCGLDTAEISNWGVGGIGISLAGTSGNGTFLRLNMVNTSTLNCTTAGVPNPNPAVGISATTAPKFISGVTIVSSALATGTNCNDPNTTPKYAADFEGGGGAFFYISGWHMERVWSDGIAIGSASAVIRFLAESINMCCIGSGSNIGIFHIFSTTANKNLAIISSGVSSGGTSPTFVVKDDNYTSIASTSFPVVTRYEYGPTGKVAYDSTGTNVSNMLGGLAISPISTSQVSLTLNNPTSTTVDIQDWQTNAAFEGAMTNAGIMVSNAGFTVGSATNCSPCKFKVNNNGQFTVMSGVTTAGFGAPGILGVTSQKSETGADASVLSVTPAATIGSYRLRIHLVLSAASAATLGWTATWTDSAGNAQTPTNEPLYQSGTATPALTFTTSAAGDYWGDMGIDTNNAGTAIVIKTTFSGTSVAYKASATIERLQ